MPAPITCWVPTQSSLVSTQCQLASTNINSVSSSLRPLPSDKVTLSSDSSRKMASWLSVLGSELKTNSMRQKSWCMSRTSFSLPCINPQDLFCTESWKIAWNQWKSCRTCQWVWQAKFFLSLLTWSNKYFAVRNERKARKGIGKGRNRKGRPEKLGPLLVLLPVAC